MIRDTTLDSRAPGLTSDAWHVVHARWNGVAKGAPSFDRSIVSEHADLDTAREAARALWRTLEDSMARRPQARRDQLFVRKPEFKTRKQAGRVEKREK